MKKSLIALAVLGSVAGAAQAQSVTLYGLVDLWTGRTSETDYTTNPAGVKSNNTVLNSGGLNGSRWGLKGEEDLGGGLKAVFKIESGFSADTGVGNSGPNRQSYVGLAGGFGEVTFGNVWSAMDDIIGAANSGFDSALSASNNVLAVPASYVDRPKNAFKYVSPNFGGFSGGFTYSLDEKTSQKTNQTDFSLSYSAGPIAANFAYEVQGESSGIVAGQDVKLTALNGSYDLGVAKLLASYGNANLGGGLKATDIQFGADIPLSSALTLSAGYAQSKFKDTDVKSTGFGLAATYSLSKRSTAYTGVRTNKTKNGGTTLLKGNLFAVGLRHTF